MKIAYIDPVGGIAGDMLLGALLDCFGKEEEDYVIQNLRRLPLPSWQWQRRIIVTLTISKTSLKKLVFLKQWKAAVSKHLIF